jgi:hypothetical protein
VGFEDQYRIKQSLPAHAHLKHLDTEFLAIILVASGNVGSRPHLTYCFEDDTGQLVELLLKLSGPSCCWSCTPKIAAAQAVECKAAVTITDHSAASCRFRVDGIGA